MKMQESTRKKLAIGNMLSLGSNLLVLVIFASITMALHSKFERAFSDLDVELSVWTRFFIRMPHSMLFYPVLILAAVFLIAKEWLIQSLLARFIINKGFFVLMILLLVGYLAAMMMPLYSVAQTP